MSPLDPQLRQELLDRFRAEELPRLAEFFAAYLHEDWSLEYGSPAEAAYDYLAGADLPDIEELAGEWSVLATLGRELPLAEFNRLLQERFGSRWTATSEAEIEAVRRELERALLE